MKGGYLELRYMQNMSSRKSHGVRGLERVTGVKKDGWGWVNVIWTAPRVRMGQQRKVLVWDTGLFDRLDFLGVT